MMGLLGDSWDDPKSMATMQLVAGLLSPGSFGQGLGKGLAGYQGALMGSADLKQKAQTLEIEKQQLAMQQLQMQMAIRKQAWMFGDDSPAPAGDLAPSGAPASGGAPAGVPGGTPAPMTQGAASSALMGGRFGGLPQNITRADMVLNDGKEIPKMMMEMLKPTSLRPGGYASYPDGRMEQLPQVPEGFTSTRGPNGWEFNQVGHGTDAVGASAAAKASGAAGYHQTEVIGPDNVPYKAFNKDLPGFSGPAMPPAARPPAGYTTPPGFRVSPAAQAASDATAMQIAQKELETAPPGPDRDQLIGAIQRMKAGGSPVPTNIGSSPIDLSPALPSSAVRTGFAPGAVAGAEANAKNAQGVMTESYKTVMAGNASAAAINARLQGISELASKAITGGNTEWRDFANNLLSIAGVSERATDRKTAGDLIEKYNSQIALGVGAGAQGTDALRAMGSAANPNRKMTPAAMQDAASQLGAATQAQQAKAQYMTPIYNAGKTADYNNAEQEFDKSADYRLWQLKDMNPAQTLQFRAQIGEKQWGELKAKAQALKAKGIL